MPPAMVEFEIVSSSPRPVRIFVVKAPSSTTVPSCSPMRTYSPGRSVRVYITMSPLAAWPTRLVEPSEIMRPTSTESPLKASLSDPGRYG